MYSRELAQALISLFEKKVNENICEWAEKNLIPWYSASDLHELKLDYK